MNEEFSHLAVEFYLDQIQNRQASEKAGRPVHDDVEMVRIRAAGDNKTVFVAPAHDFSARRNPETNVRLTYAELHSGPYEAFKNGVEYVGSGTRLINAGFLTAAKCKDLQALSIHTVEQLADLEGPNLKRLGMGARELKEKAQAYLDSTAGNADVLRLTSENEAMKQRLADLEALMQGKQEQPKVEISKNTQSPFEDWDNETIIAWIEEQGGQKPHHKSGRDTIIKAADELNEKLAKEAA